MDIKVKEITCKGCLTKSKLSDYVINPYTGCSHGCKYCYADFIRTFQNIKEEWGSFLYAKMNCPDLIEKELEKAKPGNIWLSSVTDCYNPFEARFQLTRRILEKISKSKFRSKFTIEILTKSVLVKRDFDLLKSLNAELGMSINTLDEKTARLIEPLASSPMERIKTLKEAKEKGLKVFGFISPVLPGITNLEELFRELSFCDYVWVELLNTNPSVMSRLMPTIKKEFPDKLKDFDHAIKNSTEYFFNKKREIEGLSKKYNLRVIDLVRHDLTK